MSHEPQKPPVPQRSIIANIHSCDRSLNFDLLEGSEHDLDNSLEVSLSTAFELNRVGVDAFFYGSDKYTATNESIERARLRTLVADRWCPTVNNCRDLHAPVPWLLDSCAVAWLEIMKKGDKSLRYKWSISEFERFRFDRRWTEGQDISATEMWAEFPAVPFWRATVRTGVARAFCFLESEGERNGVDGESRWERFMGLCPLATIPGDVVLVFDGGAVPYVLRPTNTTDGDNSNEVFELVGEAYVHGMMDGQAVRLVDHASDIVLS